MKPYEQVKLIQELRKLTALPLLKCKDALIRSNWDLEKAQLLLRKENPMPGFHYNKVKEAWAQLLRSGEIVDYSEIRASGDPILPAEEFQSQRRICVEIKSFDSYIKVPTDEELLQRKTKIMEKLLNELGSNA